MTFPAGALEIQLSLDMAQARSDAASSNTMISAAMAQMKSSVAGAGSQFDGLSDSVKRNINAMVGATDATKSASYAGASLIASLKDQIATLGMTKDQLTLYKANLLGVGDEAQKLVARLDAMKSAESSFSAELNTGKGALAGHGAEATAAGGAIEGFSFKTAAAKRELLVLAHELSQGNYSRFGGSMMVLGERTGAMSLLFSAAGMAILAEVGAVAAFTFAIIKGAMESAEFNKQMKLTGDYAGITEGQFNAMAQSMATGSKVGIGSAREMLQGLAATGQFSGATLTIAGQTAIDFAKLSGMSSEDVVKDFEKMSDGVAAWAESHNKHYHFLTAAQYDHIATLEKEGQSEQAMQETMAAFDDHAKKNADNLGYLSTAWHATGMALSSFWDVLKGIGRDTTVEQKVASAQQQLKSAQANLAALGGAGQDSDNARKIKATMDEVAANLLIYKTQQDLQESDKRDAALQDQLHAKAIQAVKDHQAIVDSLKTGAQQGEDAVKKYLAGQQSIVAEGTMAADDEKTRLATMAGIRKQYAEKEVAAKLTDFQKLSKLINEKITAQDMELASDTKLSDGQKLAAKFAADLRDGVIKLSDAEKLRTTNLLETLIADEKANQAKIDAKKSYDELIKSITSVGDAELKRLNALIDKQTEHNAEIGKTKDQIEAMKQAATGATVVQMQGEQTAIEQLLKEKGLNEQARGIYAAMLTDINNLIAAKTRLASAQGTGAIGGATQNVTALDDKMRTTMLVRMRGVETEKVALYAETARKRIALEQQVADVAIAAARASASGATAEQEAAYASFTAIVTKTIDDLNAKSTIDFKIAGLADMSTQLGEMAKTASTLGDGFKGATTALEGLSKGFKTLSDIEKKEAVTHKEDLSGRIGAYGDMASAASNFFEVGSAGYKTLQGVAEVAHAAQMAMNLVEMGQMAVKAVLNQASGDPYSAFFRMAAMAAAVGALGFAVSGGFDSGGSSASAADVQKTQNSGTVLGDATAKSNSIADSLKLIGSNSDITLTYTQQMARSLQNIEASIAGVANIIFRTNGIASGTVPGLQTGTLSKNTGDPILGMFGINDSFLTKNLPVIGGLITALQGLWGKTTQNVTDSGFTASGTLGQFGQGTGISQYANVDRTQSSWFGLVKKTTSSQINGELGPELSRQFGQLFTNLGTVIKTAGAALGLNSDSVLAAINNFSINLPLSIKGLTGTALSDAINNWISTISDTAVQAIIPGMQEFQQVGEGYFQTVVRVATGVESAKSALEKLGVTAISYTDIINKQGDVMAEISRQSIVAAEGGKYTTKTTSSLFGASTPWTTDTTLDMSKSTGIGKIIDGFAGTGPDMIALYTQLVAVRDVLKSFNASLQDVTIDMIKGAGSLADLQKGITTYYDKYFTAQEKADAGIADMTAKFAALGVPLPATTDAFRALVSGLDMTTVAGQTMYGKLMALSGGFYDASTAVTAIATAAAAAATQLADAKTAMQIQLLTAQGDSKGATALSRQQTLNNLTDTGLIALQQQVWAAQDLKAALTAAATAAAAAANAAASAYFVGQDRNKQIADLSTTANAGIDKFFGTAAAASDNGLAAATAANAAASAAASNWQAAAASIQSALASVQDQTAQLVDSYGTALAKFQSLTVLARGGDANSAGALGSAAQSFLTASLGQSVTLQDYLRDRAKIENSLTDTLGVANIQASAQDMIVQNTAATVTTLTAMNTTLSGFAADVYEMLKKGYQGADSGTATTAAASLATMTGDLKTYFATTKEGDKTAYAGGASFTRLSGDITQFNGADGSILGYLKSTESILEVAKQFPEIRAAWEAQYGIKLPSFAVGTGYVPHDMLAQIHQGEEITPRPFVDMQRAARDETNVLLRKLTETNDTMKTELVNVKAELVQIKGTNLRISQITEKSDAIGPAPARATL